MSGTPLRERKAWQALLRHHEEIAGRHLRDLFAEDPGRGERLTAEAAGIFLDYSKNRVTDETMRLLVELAEESGVTERRDAMFRGEHINVSEDRAVLHVALRMPADESLVVDGTDVVARGARGARPDAAVRQTGSGRVSGPVTPASGSATWSTSASAVPTWGPSWRTRRCGTTARAR